jgi:two-component system, response regulator PdtaR
MHLPGSSQSGQIRSESARANWIFDQDMIPDTSASTSATSRPLRVLIVEDENLTSLFLQGVLRDLGYGISGIAPSLRTALAIAAGTPSDFAIVDVGLAGDGGDGIDTAAALWERHQVRSVLMTGATFAEFADRIQFARPLGLLAKPFTEKDVEKAMIGAIQQITPASAS